MIHFLAAMMGRLSGLARRCPACKRIQILPKRKKMQTVRCKFCGQDMPPKKLHPK